VGGSRHASLIVLTLGGVAVATLLALHTGPRPAAMPATPSTPAGSTGTAQMLRDEALSLYAAGDFAPACERFSRAAAADPGSPAHRADVASCFETWGWRALREDRAGEAQTLFAQGLRERPGTPALLRGLGIAAIHAGRPDQAITALEKAVAIHDETDARLLLARLYDQRNDDADAIRHLRAVLAREPQHPPARALLGKLERERAAEAGFRVERTAHFVVKWRADAGHDVPRVVGPLLDAARRRLDAQLGYRSAHRVSVVLYDDRQFHAVTLAHGGVGGVFDGKIRLPVDAVTADRAMLERLIVHEYAHAAIHDLSRGRAPRWLHEGLAQLLEGASADPALRLRSTVTLATLETLLGDADPGRARAAYDLALWIVHDLAGRGGFASLRALLDRIATGEPPAVALARVYGPRLAELESQWRFLLSS
jgi:tetratricopeptide (TPR) repeat protein